MSRRTGAAYADVNRCPSPFRLAHRFALRASSPLPPGEGSQQAQRPRPLADRIIDPPGLSQRDLVGEADHGPAQRLDLRLAKVIAQDDIVAVMHAAVDLDDQPQLHAGEVNRPAPDVMLPTDLEPVDGAAAQPRPDPLFSEAGGLTQIAGAGHDVRLHCSPTAGKPNLTPMPQPRALRSTARKASAVGATAAGAASVGALGVGVLAVGALAVGALAIGVLKIGQLKVKGARVRRLHVDELSVGVLRIGKIERGIGD